MLAKFGLTTKNSFKNILEQGTRLEGNFSFKENLLIKGVLKGNIHGDSIDLTLAKTSDVTIDSNLTCKSLHIDGGGLAVQGDLQADQLIISNNGLLTVKGVLKVNELKIESGAKFEGNISTMKKEVEPKKNETGSASMAKDRLKNITSNTNEQANREHSGVEIL